MRLKQTQACDIIGFKFHKMCRQHLRTQQRSKNEKHRQHSKYEKKLTQRHHGDALCVVVVVLRWNVKLLCCVSVFKIPCQKQICDPLDQIHACCGYTSYSRSHMTFYIHYSIRSFSDCSAVDIQLNQKLEQSLKYPWKILNLVTSLNF